ncbi:MAG: pyridoxal phosphate-dependent aminotransferase [Brevinematales bacterium]|nr:pyridoxal phosphate-dependent aminotransferase [Brevinematales bacterium]
MRLSKRLVWQAENNSWTEMLANTQITHDLTLSNPTEAFDLSGYQEDILAALSHPEALLYNPSPLGLLKTREFLAEVLEIPGGISPCQILLTTSTSEAYSLLFKLLCDPGDEVLVPVPSYPLFEYLAKLENVRIVPYRLEYTHGKGYDIDFSSIEKSISPKTKALVYVHPNNPTGTGASLQEIATLNSLTTSSSLAIIVDEVFSDYWVRRPSSIPSSWWGLVDGPLFVLGGLSKSLLLPQMKLAWTLFHAPSTDLPALTKAIELLGDTYLSPSLPIQLALPSWWKLKPGLTSMVIKRLNENLALLHSLLENSPCRVQTSHGGWSAVIEIPRILSEEDITHHLGKRGVKIYPGYFFDFENEGHLVVSLLTPPASLKSGISILLEVLEEEISKT